jgi:hypothetical protein
MINVWVIVWAMFMAWPTRTRYIGRQETATKA